MRPRPPRDDEAPQLPRASADGADATAWPGYVRRTDWLRAQFLPQLSALDFRGLFVGNKGPAMLGSRRARPRGFVDPSHVTNLLLQANGHRSRGEHLQALRCYQELVELEPFNADFRFLLETTYQAIATHTPTP